MTKNEGAWIDYHAASATAAAPMSGESREGDILDFGYVEKTWAELSA